MPQSFLDEVYNRMDYAGGALLNATAMPDDSNKDEWMQKGDWLSLAKEVGAEKVFFVNNDPVIIFCDHPDILLTEELRERELLKTFRRIWCMARPICLFIALPDELRVYSLNKRPVQDINTWNEASLLTIVRKVADVAEKLQDYRREEVESGRLFADSRFGEVDQRADKCLIQDLKLVRQKLLNAGLKAKYAHALIGRSIFIRYLEDRGVITAKYFQDIAKKNYKWQVSLERPLEKSDFMPGEEFRFYNRVLPDKDFTYALFEQLAEDFNGDMFPKDEQEKEAVKYEHLELLRNFLLGDPDEKHPHLFFWAYDFKVIPIELISNIYEEFYHVHKNREDTGTHYTPSTLVDYILSQVLDEQCLAKNPRILDPACGSGIFLVEAFRRIVRYRIKRLGKPLSALELKNILRDQITGIEINEEAVRIAAFSLYLALLHYQEPSDILNNKPLPNLISNTDRKMNNQHYRVLFHANAFGLTQTEKEELYLRAVRERQGRTSIIRLLNAKKGLDIELHSFDVIVGNPPWSEGEYYVSCENYSYLEKNIIPKPFSYKTDPHILSASKEILPKHVALAKQVLPKEFHPLVDEIKSQSDEFFQALGWARAYNKPFGDKSYAQLFVYRALSFVKEDGLIGLLLHANILFNQSSTTREFRQCWLSSARIIQIANFVRVRNLFFGNAVAPFIFACFERKQTKLKDSYLTYNTAQLTNVVEHLRSVILAKADRRLVRQSDFQHNDYLWRTYAWGNHRDAALLAALELEDHLQDILERIDSNPGYGFQRGSDVPSSTLQHLRSLGSRNVTWYGPLRDEWFEEQPTGVKRDPNEVIYRGQRLIIIRGAKALQGICIRLEHQDFSFRHTIYGIPLPDLSEWQAKLIVGTLWSSLGRYRLFMTAGKWGLWHDEIGAQDILSMPIRLPKQVNPIVQTIINAVDKIRAWDPYSSISIWPDKIVPDLSIQPSQEILKQLDDAIFDLFELSESERDLIKDFVQYKFDLFSNDAKAKALAQLGGFPERTQGSVQSISSMDETQTEIEGYIRTFLSMWNRELEPDGEFQWRIIRPSSAPMISVIFTLRQRGFNLSNTSFRDDQAWREVITRLEALKQPISRRIYIDGMARIVTDTDIIIIKRNERRLWTRGIAREDAEATLLQAINLQEVAQER